jgi:hypothetical protein
MTSRTNQHCGTTLRLRRRTFLKGTAHQMIAMAAAAKAQGDLGVIDGHDIGRDAVVRDCDAGRRIELEPVLLDVVANRVGVHGFLQIHNNVGEPPSTGSSGSRIPGSSLSGLFTRVEIGHIIMSSAG